MAVGSAACALAMLCCSLVGNVLGDPSLGGVGFIPLPLLISSPVVQSIELQSRHIEGQKRYDEFYAEICNELQMHIVKEWPQLQVLKLS